MKKVLVFCLLFAAFAAAALFKPAVNNPTKDIKAAAPPKAEEQKQPIENKPKQQLEFIPSFTYSPIDEEIEARINGLSWKKESPVKISDLSYVQVSYWGFDQKPHTGELIVNSELALDIVEIFEELFNERFPIEKINLIDDYAADDGKSMADNNTSAYCYREVEGKPGTLSRHSFGAAIDINPVQNPYVYKDEIVPESGKEYVDRSKQAQGMIIKGDACYKAFTSRGWTWGGDWKYEKDYQHFQKLLRKN